MQPRPKRSLAPARDGPAEVPAIAGRIEPSSDLSDGQLVQAVLAGDRSAFDRLIAKYQRQAIAVAYRLLGNTNDALEITQDAFLKAFRSLPTLQRPEAFGGWLMRIVSNLSLNYRRGRKTRGKGQLPLDDLLGAESAGGESPDAGGAASEWASKDGDPGRQLQSRELGARLQEAMELLPEKQRLAIVMFAIEELPQKQVAETLGCSVEAVKWYVFQGRKKLRELLKEHLLDD